MPDADKIASLEERVADLRKRNAALQARCDQRARRVALLEETISSMQDKLDHANGFS